MGIGGMGPWSLLLILAIVILLFGTKKLRNIGSDLGNAFKSFRKAVKDDDKDKLEEKESGETIEGETHKEKDKL